MNIWIKNGRLIDPHNNIDAKQDVFIADKRIAGIGMAPHGFVAEQVIDAAGLIVMPGRVDVAARLREPGYEYKATLESISTPRFIGPGCITMASALASASRSCVKP